MYICDTTPSAPVVSPTRAAAHWRSGVGELWYASVAGLRTCSHYTHITSHHIRTSSRSTPTCRLPSHHPMPAHHCSLRRCGDYIKPLLCRQGSVSGVVMCTVRVGLRWHAPKTTRRWWISVQLPWPRLESQVSESPLLTSVMLPSCTPETQQVFHQRLLV